MSNVTEVTCKSCNTLFEARTADVNRGWGKFCSKSCKAKKQTQQTGICGPHYKADGKTIKQMSNGQYAKSKFSGRRNPSQENRWFPTNISYEEWDEDVINGDVRFSHRHQCWLAKDTGEDPLIDAHPFDSDAAGFNNT